MNIPARIKKQKEFFISGNTRSFDSRIHALNTLKKNIRDMQNDIEHALYLDLHKSKTEAFATEIGMCLEEITFTVKHLKRWMQEKRVPGAKLFFGTKGRIVYEPYGCTLIISPWNYPFQLAISPLIGAIAAGNCAVVKPSEMAPHTSFILAKLIQNTFSPEFVHVENGDKAVVEELLDQSFDHIFYTGNTQVGRSIMKKAAERLTPLTLELGGKSPCIVDEDCDIEKTARRITWGKFLNAGQTCVAPDYVLVHKNIKNRLVKKIEQTIETFFGASAHKSPDFGRIINDKHLERLRSYLAGVHILYGGVVEEEGPYLSPTLVDEPAGDHVLMQEEIFGPILPIVGYTDIQEAIECINKKPKPLALYIFSQQKSLQEYIIRHTQSGGVCVNDTILHLADLHLPFGGIGASGVGNYHGKASFECFSHKKSILIQTNAFDLPMRYPPHSDKKHKLFTFLMK